MDYRVYILNCGVWLKIFLGEKTAALKLHSKLLATMRDRETAKRLASELPGEIQGVQVIIEIDGVKTTECKPGEEKLGGERIIRGDWPYYFTGDPRRQITEGKIEC